MSNVSFELSVLFVKHKYTMILGDPGAVSGGKKAKRARKKSGEEKSRTKVGAPGILLLTAQFRNHLKSLPVIGHKNIFLFVLLSFFFSCYFRDFLFEGVQRKLLARLFAIYLLAHAGEFPSIKKCH